jgi:hypothetical protein
VLREDVDALASMREFQNQKLTFLDDGAVDGRPDYHVHTFKQPREFMNNTVRDDASSYLSMA